MLQHKNKMNNIAHISILQTQEHLWWSINHCNTNKQAECVVCDETSDVDNPHRMCIQKMKSWRTNDNKNQPPIEDEGKKQLK